MHVKVTAIVAILFSTTAAQLALPWPPENVLFQLTSHDSFVLAWNTPPGLLDYYILDYYPDGKTLIEEAINKTETHHIVVNPNLDLKTFGVNFYSVLDNTRSEPANLTVLVEHDERLPPPVNSATKQWVSESVQLQWTLPQGQYDELLLLFAPEDGGVLAQSAYLNSNMTSYRLSNLSREIDYVIRLYTVRNGILSDPAVLQELTAVSGESVCDENPCKNDGECKENEDDPSLYRCDCIRGYDGTICENNIDDCATNLCQNGGQCIDGDNTFTCVCASGFKGETCQKRSGGVVLRASVILIGLMYALCGNLL